MEEFIKKLLSSDKFDELAEKIADKAAKKVYNFQNSVQLARNDNYTSRDNRSPIYRINVKPEINENNTKLKIKPKASNISNHKKKINKELVMKTAQLMPLKELSLRYKHFIMQTRSNESQVSRTDVTKSTKKYINVRVENPLDGEQILDKSIHDSVDEIVSNGSKEIPVTSVAEENDTSTEDFNFLLGNTNNINSKKNIEDTSKSVEQKPNAEINATVKNSNDSELHSEETSKEEDAEISNENSSNANLELNVESNVVKNNDGNSTKRNKSRMMTHYDNINEISVKTNSIETDDNEVFAKNRAKQLKTNLESKTRNKPVQSRLIRKEGSKLFTFETSPDYDEYHDEVAKLEKENAKNINFIKDVPIID
ncbi:putative uncharacterized protein DDB_G0274535 [Achroia grisella]|uniref:putative uncharacterized protein DDB_G0274535 n=1 Tax=Achroia grisella TaxID=688607 RepID=UPI0027D2D6E0|nr:putative uncharacterized protein DDB_G0274535 [Achroia grisella]